MAVSESMLIVPNFKIPVDERQFLTSAMCFRDKVQWIFRSDVCEGFSDSYVVTCPICGNDCLAYGDKRWISSDNEIEVCGWLVEEKQTLFLAVLESTSEIQKNALQAIIEKHDFSMWFSQIRMIQSLENFHRKRKRILRKNLTLGSLLLKFSTKKTSTEKSTLKSTGIKQAQHKDENEKKATNKNSSKNSKPKINESTKALLKKFKQIAKDERSVPQGQLSKKFFEAFQIGHCLTAQEKLPDTLSSIKDRFIQIKNRRLTNSSKSFNSAHSTQEASEQNQNKSKSRSRTAKKRKFGGQFRAIMETPSQSQSGAE